MRTIAALKVGSMAALTAFALISAERDARACGGCFAPPGESESVVTDHKMVFSISSQQTTLYDQIRYSGSPSSFAWVLPIADSNAAKLGLSADVLFGTLDSLTQTRVLAPPLNCPSPPTDCTRGTATPGAAGDFGTAADAGVTVNKHEVVGPYVTDYVHSTDPNALNAWLVDHGYAIPPDVAPVIAKYVTEHYDFIAMKLVPGAGVEAMRPVRVSTPGASPILPLRMVAAGTGPTVGVTLWVIGDGRYDTDNFPSFTIKPEDIVWNWIGQGGDSNYSTLRLQNEDRLGGRGWEIESSISVTQEQIANVIRNGGFGFGGGFGPGGPGFYDAGSDYLPVGTLGGADGGTFETADQVRDEDIATLFAGIDRSHTRVTRMRADLARAALDADLRLKASADQAELSNVKLAQKEANQPDCPVYRGCSQDGTAPRDQAAAQTNANNSAHESFSCATKPADPFGIPLVAGILASILGLTAIRRRKS